MAFIKAALPLLLLFAGCSVHDRDRDPTYTYCDASGCYACDENGCSIGSDPGPAPTGCDFDTDCRGDQSCVDGQCAPVGSSTGCSTDAECGVGSTCVNGACQVAPTREPACLQSSDCAAGLECVDAICRASCYTALDCAACGSGRQRCADGYCE